MIWKSHLLRPASYVKYCNKYFGGLIDHTVIGTQLEYEILQPGLEQTIKIWNEEYQERYLIPERANHGKSSGILIDSPRTVKTDFRPQGPIYYHDLQHVSDTYRLSSKNTTWENILSFSPREVLNDILWIKIFHLSVQTTGEVSFQDGKMKFYDNGRTSDSVVYRLTKSYERFLYLVANNRLFISEPETSPFCISNAVDVIRQTHMLHPKIYNAECKKLVRYVPHYGSINNSPSDRYMEWSNALWKAEYEVPMERDYEYQTSFEEPIMRREISCMTVK